MKFREAARVVLLNARNEVFLLQSKDLDDPASRFWQPCGGGAELGESPRQTAARELAEEAGVECEPVELLGPLATRHAVLDFARKRHEQDEVFFGIRIDEELDLSDAVWTEMEKRVIVDARWWSREELLATEETVYPSRLPELMDLVAQGRTPAQPLEIG
ncbi:NUDIX domain-containing protein [Brevibacterium sp. 5221]|uniref:NUDIX domain-containing protein n=1 Tax=Brevibacterium rongguiense TaxID=2695267 RepID=A0A6N9H8A8_9MICO|nr:MULTISPECIES: NUDIX domain-containing protein [Brevibacterium]MYM20111.1 NUDIX domain-containing protein [Brevibacterium rongguiense]WAL40935.1 NUDIX domain-containing protein [Brevibacterium sp. BRM-1]